MRPVRATPKIRLDTHRTRLIGAKSDTLFYLFHEPAHIQNDKIIVQSAILLVEPENEFFMKLGTDNLHPNWQAWRTHKEQNVSHL